jgi:hypothetical protein
MITFSDHLPLFRSQLIVQEFFLNNFISWDKKKKKVKITAHSRPAFKVMQTIMVFYLLVVVHRFFDYFHKNEFSSKHIVSILACFLIIMSALIAIPATFTADDIAELYNGLLKMENNPKSGKIFPCLIIIILLNEILCF